MSPSEKKQKHPHHKKAMKGKQNNAASLISKKKGKNSSFGKRKVSKVDREIKEIESIHKRLEEINSLEESERKKIVRFDALPISNYTKQGRFFNRIHHF